MPYFTSNYYSPKIIVQSKLNPQGTVREKLKSEYPQSHIKIEHALPQETEYDSGQQYKSEEETTVSHRMSTVKTAIIVFLLYVFAVQATKITAPQFVTELYMKAYDTVTATYSTVLAKTTSGNYIQFSNQNNNYKETSETYIENSVPTISESADTEEILNTVNGNTGFYFEKYIGTNAEDGDSNKHLQVSKSEDTRGQTTESVIKRDLSRSTDKIYLQNETNLTPDINSMAVSAYPIDEIAYGEENPQVLIVHTHGTESYSDSKTGTSRSTDRTENVVRVGAELEKVLNFYGIPTIHSKTMHDEVSYITAYSGSKKEVQRILSQHPTIKYVIDLHRDALPSENQTPVKPYTQIGGEGTAQVMLVVGTNAGGGNHPEYTKNLTVAAHIQKTLNELYPTLARPINVRNAIFNQNLCSGSILLEVGSDANTLDEAIRAVRYFGEAFARVVKDNEI